MALERKVTDPDVAEALAYIESLIRALRRRLVAGRRGRSVPKSSAAGTRFPARSCRLVAEEIAGTPEAGA